MTTKESLNIPGLGGLGILCTDRNFRCFGTTFTVPSIRPLSVCGFPALLDFPWMLLLGDDRSFETLRSFPL